MVISQRPIFVPRLSFKLTLPYVVLAMVLALATIYFVVFTQASKVTTEFSRQIADARERVGDNVVQAERAQIDHVRTLAHVAGLPEALRAGDSAKLLDLLKPFAVSQRIERIVLTDLAGSAVIGIASRGADVTTLVANPAIASWQSVANVLRGASDQQGDKY